VATYRVLPLSENVGLIEWVDGTTTLKSLMYDEGDPCTPPTHTASTTSVAAPRPLAARSPS
jgi:hypothetical protein